MAQIGWRLTPEAVQRVYGDDYEPAEARTEAAGASPVEAAERDDDPPTPPDLVAERLEREAQPIVDGWLDRIRGLVEQASTLEELRGLILEAFGDLPADELTELLAQALLASELAGRSDTVDQSRG